MKKQPLGQNYLINESIALDIIQQAGVSPDQPVLEIGPGKGILTAILLEQAESLTAIEIDPKLCSALKDRFGKNEKFQLIEADALKYDYGAL
ncbi:MAG: rRNA adenine N-6-methyltransferase family protein, partial [Nitrospinaceae bacterium]|nr:rRNA adenine N-6-methyltransferase family protein [Nitrospinaceae bacterium]